MCVCVGGVYICFLFEAADTGTGDVRIKVPVAQVYNARVCVLWEKALFQNHIELCPAL